MGLTDTFYNQSNPTDVSADKIRAASDAKIRKLNSLGKNTQTTLNGETYSDKNKIYNQESGSQLQARLGDVATQQVFKRDDGSYYQFGQDEQGNQIEKDYTGALRRLYGYNQDDSFKIGLSRGDKDSSDPRYDGSVYAKAGPKGVQIGGENASDKLFDFLLPYDVATQTEAVFHGNVDNFNDRKFLRSQGQGAYDQYGAGASEYYTSIDDVLDAKGDFSKDTYEDFSEDASIAPSLESKYAQPISREQISKLLDLKAESRGENLVDAVQASVGRFAASTGDAIVDAGLRIYKETSGLSEKEASAKAHEYVNSTVFAGAIDAKGDFVGLDKYKLEEEYGYDSTKINDKMAELHTAFKEGSYTDKALAFLSAVEVAPELLASSTGDILAAMTGPVGLAAIVGGQMNRVLKDRADIKGTTDLEFSDYVIASASALAYGVINKVSGGAVGLKEIKPVLMKAAGMVGEEGLKKIIAGTVNLIGRVGTKSAGEALEEAAQGMTEILGTKYGTKDEDSIFSEDTAERLYTDAAAGFGAGVASSGIAEAKPLLKGAQGITDTVKNATTKEEVERIEAQGGTVDTRETIADATADTQGIQKDLDVINTSISNNEKPKAMGALFNIIDKAATLQGDEKKIVEKEINRLSKALTASGDDISKAAKSKKLDVDTKGRILGSMQMGSFYNSSIEEITAVLAHFDDTEVDKKSTLKIAKAVKTLKDVEGEVTTGSRGYVTYFQEIKKAQATGNGKKENEYKSKMSSFIGSQRSKLKAYNTAIKNRSKVSYGTGNSFTVNATSDKQLASVQGIADKIKESIYAMNTILTETGGPAKVAENTNADTEIIPTTNTDLESGLSINYKVEAKKYKTPEAMAEVSKANPEGTPVTLQFGKGSEFQATLTGKTVEKTFATGKGTNTVTELEYITPSGAKGSTGLKDVISGIKITPSTNTGTVSEPTSGTNNVDIDEDLGSTNGSSIDFNEYELQNNGDYDENIEYELDENGYVIYGGTPTGKPTAPVIEPDSTNPTTEVVPKVDSTTTPLTIKELENRINGLGAQIDKIKKDKSDLYAIRNSIKANLEKGVEGATQEALDKADADIKAFDGSPANKLIVERVGLIRQHKDMVKAKKEEDALITGKHSKELLANDPSTSTERNLFGTAKAVKAMKKLASIVMGKKNSKSRLAGDANSYTIYDKFAIDEDLQVAALNKIILAKFGKVIADKDKPEVKFKAPKFNGNESVLWLDESPARLLMTSNGTFSNNTVAAIGKAITDWTLSSGNTLVQRSPDRVAKMLGIEVEAVTADMMNHLGDKAYKKLIANELGAIILKDVGLTSRNDVPQSQYEQLVADLGQMAVIIAGEVGVMTKIDNDEKFTMSPEKYKSYTGQEYESKEIDDDSGTLESVLVSLTQGGRELLGDKQNYIKLQQMSEALGTELSVKLPGFEQPKKPRVVPTDKNPVYDTPKESQDAINAMEKEPWVIDEETYALYNDPEIKAIVKKSLKFKTDAELDMLGGVDRQAQVAKNNAILLHMKNLENVKELVDRRGTRSKELYFKWFFSINGRFMLDSNTLNPQNNKLHRFMVGLKKNMTVVNSADKTQMDVFHIAIAQAAGYDIDKNSLEDSIAKGVKYREGGSKAFLEGIKAKEGAANRIKPEEIGHALQAVTALKAYEARAKNGHFSTNLTLETDAVTSGIILKMLQLPVMRETKEWLKKGGVLFADDVDYNDFKGMNNLLGSGAIDDAYKTIARNYNDLLPDVKDYDPVIKNDTKENHGAKNRKAIAMKMDVIMPKILDEDGKVTKDGRNLFKPVLMVFGYGGGVKGILNKFSSEVVESMPTKALEELLAGKPGKYTAALKQAMGNGSKITNTQLIKAIKDQEIDMLSLPGVRIYGKKNTTIRESLMVTMNERYGSTIETMLKTTFPEIFEANQVINNTFRHMFNMYNVAYQDKLKEFNAKHNRAPSNDEKIVIYKQLKKVFPSIKAPFSDENSKSLIVKHASKPGDSVAKTHGNYENGQNTLTINSMIKEFESSISSGNVVSIHYIDGSMLADVMKKYAVATVHDALVVPIGKAIDANKEYNKSAHKHATEYNLAEELLATIETAKEALTAEQLSRVESLEIFVDGEIEEQTVDMTIQAVSDLNDVVTNNKKWLHSQDSKIDHMTGLGAVYGAKGTGDKTEFVPYGSTIASKGPAKPTPKRNDGKMSPEEKIKANMKAAADELTTAFTVKGKVQKRVQKILELIEGCV